MKSLKFNDRLIREYKFSSSKELFEVPYKNIILANERIKLEKEEARMCDRIIYKK